MNMINKNDFVEIEFTGRIKDGEIFDTSRKEDAEKAGLDKSKCEPLEICLGQRMIVKGFDDAIEGKEIGKEYNIELNPENAFGKREIQLVKTFPTKIFTSKGMVPQPGMMYSFDNVMAKIVSVSGGRAIVDFNNPLSGKIIVYDFIIKRKIDDSKEKIAILTKAFLQIKNPEIAIDGKNAKLIFEIKIPDSIFDILRKKVKEILDIDLALEVKEAKIEEKAAEEEKKEEKKEKGGKEKEKNSENKEKKEQKMKTELEKETENESEKKN
jgi:FKBP-type peptidyl-prolyl cis-trans isomerase SlyD